MRRSSMGRISLVGKEGGQTRQRRGSMTRQMGITSRSRKAWTMLSPDFVNQIMCQEEDVVDALIGALRGGVDETRLWAATALANLATVPANRMEIVRVDGISSLLEPSNSRNRRLAFEASRALTLLRCIQ